MNYAETLLKFCEKIKIEESQIKNAESIIDYHLAVDSNVMALRSISKQELDHLLEIFGQSLSLKIGDAPTLFEINYGKTDYSFENALKTISKLSETLTIRIEIRINKSIILDQLKENKRGQHRVFYIFYNNLSKFLNSSLISLDTNLFKNPCQKVVIVVSDSDIYCNGPFLTIINIVRYISDEYYLVHSDKKWLEWTNKYHKVSFYNLNWIGFELKNITPIHFYCRRINGMADSIDLILINQMLNSCIIYTANRTSRDNGFFHASFSSSERSVMLEFKLQSIILDFQFDSEKYTHEQNLLLRLALWPFGDKGTDRLVIFQNVIAREFGEDSDNKNNNYDKFIKLLPGLLDQAKWHHRIFMDTQIEHHFNEIKELSQYISEVTKDVSNTFDSMTKGLTDSLMATIAVIIAALLISLAKSDANFILFKNILQLYAIYLLLFQGFYRMGSIWHSYVLLKKETEDKLESYIPIFGNKRIDALSVPFAKRRDQFVNWFIITSILYISVFVIIWILSRELPKYLLSMTNATSI